MHEPAADCWRSHGISARSVSIRSAMAPAGKVDGMIGANRMTSAPTAEAISPSASIGRPL